MSRVHAVRSLFLSSLALLVLAGPAAAVSKPDTTLFFFNQPKIDTKKQFAVTGTITEIDRTSPPDFYGDPLLVDIVGTYWKFQLTPLAVGWKIPPAPPGTKNGAHDYSFAIYGIHIDGPHDPPGPPVDIDPDTSDVAITDKANIPWGKEGTVSKTWREIHETSVANKPHWDIYGFKSKGKAVKGPDHMVNGTIGIAAKHTEDKKEKEITVNMVMGSSPAGGAYVSYDAGLGTITIHMGALDILNSVGSLSPGIEAAFLGDPFLATQFVDVTLQYLGPTGDGGYRFGGAHTTLLDQPDTTLLVQGDFSEYLIYDTSQSGQLDSYALYDSMSAENTGTCWSPFYEAFTDVNFLGDEIPEPVWEQIQGVSLQFVTSTNLASLTGGFTGSAYFIPATVAVSGSQGVTSPLAVPGDTQGSVLDPAQSHPNPFAERNTLQYHLAEAGPVRIEVFDAAGRLVRRLVDLPSQTPGDYTAVWNGTTASGDHAAAGVYYYRVTLAGRTWTRDVVMVR